MELSLSLGLSAPRSGLRATPLVISVSLGWSCVPTLHLGTMNYPTDLEFLLSTSMSARWAQRCCKTTRQRFCFVYKPDNGGKLATPPNPACLGRFRSPVRALPAQSIMLETLSSPVPSFFSSLSRSTCSSVLQGE